MSRYAVGGRATIVGSATLPFVSLYNTAAVNAHLREVHVYNTTATGAFDVALCRLSTLGTAGAGLTEVALEGYAQAAACTAFAGHTVAPTLVDLGYRKTMGAAVGDGVIWTFNNDIGVTGIIGT